ncbi:hypothetical protein BDV96DRAFT_305878 [Lophiotrema nucula]|uniref:Uncharacterized protein n=1 Tax=Lophiotrema nucula TaxID=690887 RepID=A0A6A5YLU0_9PLEO|nr:hypothetical protein BDV96DRAFT_305878 [Lophiotrema nucula]
MLIQICHAIHSAPIRRYPRPEVRSLRRLACELRATVSEVLGEYEALCRLSDIKNYLTLNLKDGTQDAIYYSVRMDYDQIHQTRGAIWHLVGAAIDCPSGPVERNLESHFKRYLAESQAFHAFLIASQRAELVITVRANQNRNPNAACHALSYFLQESLRSLESTLSDINSWIGRILKSKNRIYLSLFRHAEDMRQEIFDIQAIVSECRRTRAEHRYFLSRLLASMPQPEQEFRQDLARCYWHQRWKNQSEHEKRLQEIEDDLERIRTERNIWRGNRSERLREYRKGRSLSLTIGTNDNVPGMQKEKTHQPKKS